MLGANGLLPTGLIQVTADQVHEHFVAHFDTSKSRQRLFDQWMLHRAAITSIVPIQRQWLDGSFVTSKVNPGDIDVVTFVDGESVDALSDAQIALLGDLTDGHATRDRWGVDSFLVATYPEDHPERALSRKAEGSWRRLWTSVKGSSLTKGFLEVGA